MIKEYLNMAKQWCQQQHREQGVIGYINYSPSKIKELLYQIDPQIQPVIFLDDSFKIAAFIRNSKAVIIIVSEKCLIDPSICSFMDGWEYYSPSIKIGIDFSILRNLDFHYNERVEIFQRTIERAIIRGQVIPVLVTPKLVLAIIWEYFIQQGFYVESAQELEDALNIATRNVKLLNSLVASILCEACTQFQKMIHLKPKLTQIEIETNIVNIILLQLDQEIHTYGEQLDRIFSSGKFAQQLIIAVKYTINFLFSALEETLNLLIDNEFEDKELVHVFEICIENQMGKFSMKVPEFSLVDQADFILLFDKMKETLFYIMIDIENFIIQASSFINQQMQKVNQLFADYPALANIRTYQSIQIDVSNHIMLQLKKQYLEEDTDFWRLEFVYSEQFIKKVIIYYLNYNETKLRIPNKTSNFHSSLIRMGMDMQMPIQTYQILLKPNEPDFIAEKDELQTISVQTITQNKRTAFIINMENKESVILQIINKNITLTQSVLYNRKLWTLSGDVIPIVGTLSETVQATLKSNLEYLRFLEIQEKQQFSVHQDKQQSQVVLHFNLELKDSLKQVKLQYLDKYKEAQRVGGGNLTNPQMMAAGGVGSGLGILIVDCLDESIPWYQKLQRAGFGTAETTAFAALSFELPFIGYLVSQTLTFYSLHKVLSNKVVNMQNKMKSLGHIGMKTSMGLGSAMAGQMLIPVPVLGALIGGLLGGVGVGLYHRFVIPKTRNSLLSMVKKIQIQQDGRIQFDKGIFKILNISANHFYSTKPQQLSDDDWLTLVVMHMVNEVQYLFELQCEEERKKLIEKMEQNSIKRLIELDKEQEEVEMVFVQYEKCRYYISQQNISNFKYAKQIGIFVSGMMDNFKI